MSLPIPPDRRVACVLFPNFSLNRRITPDITELPVVLTHTTAKAIVVIALNHSARQHGLVPGMTLSQAESYCRTVKQIAFNRDQDIEYLEQLSEQFTSLTPRIEVDKSEIGILYISLHGIFLLYKSEQEFIDALVTKGKQTKLPFQIGVAENKLLARMVAQDATENSYLILNKDSQTDFLSPLPIERLQTDPYVADLFESLGIDTIEKLKTIPTNELAARFGETGSKLANDAKGIDRSHFHFKTEQEVTQITKCLDYPLTNSESLLQDLLPDLTTALEKLAASNRGCKALLLKFITENKQCIVKQVTIAYSSASIAVFQRQIRLALPNYDFDSGVIEWRIQLCEISPLPNQQTDLVTAATTVIHSDRCVVQQRVLTATKGFLPEDFSALQNSEQTDTGESQTTCLFSLKTEGLRLFTNPQVVSVMAKEGILNFFSWEHTDYRVNRQFGAWVLSGRWWDKQYERWYFEVVTTDYGRYLLFFDALDSQWYLHGIYD